MTWKATVEGGKTAATSCDAAAAIRSAASVATRLALNVSNSGLNVSLRSGKGTPSSAQHWCKILTDSEIT